jgi:uncharacterized RDD family membrane protein YckC
VDCTNCGERLDSDDTFCGRCGTGVAEAVQDDDIDQVEVASIGRRAAARVLDSVILILVVQIAASPFAEDAVVDGEVVRRIPTLAFTGALLVSFALMEIGLVLWRGQTLGKLSVRLRIVDAAGGPPTATQVVKRWALPGVLPFLVFGPFGLILNVLVYASAAWDADRRNWPDKIAGTSVVDSTV